MTSNKKLDKNLSYRNFSPFYERALAESKRGDNVLKIVEKEIDKRKMVAFSQLSAEQRMVEKDLYALRMTQKRIWEEKKKRNRRAFSETGLDEMHRLRFQGRFASTSELIGTPCARKSTVLPPLNQSRTTTASQKTPPSYVSLQKWANPSSLPRSNTQLARRSISAPTFITESGLTYSNYSASFTEPNAGFNDNC